MIDEQGVNRIDASLCRVDARGLSSFLGFSRRIENERGTAIRMTLRKKMAQGAFWSLVEKGGQQGLSFVVFALLARFLGPEEYGLANICFIYFTLACVIIHALVDGIVSLQIEDDTRLSGLFWSVAAIGLFLSLLCLGTAAPLSALMEQPKLTGLLYRFSIIPLLVALAAVPNWLILKNMDFRIYALRTLAATVAGGIVGLFLALRGFGAFAVVGQQIALYVVTNLVVWPHVKWRPHFVFDWPKLKTSLRPGIGMLGSNALGFLDEEVPRFLIALFLGPAPLGFYAFVMRLRFALASIFISPAFVALYPALSKINGDGDEQEKITTKLLLTLCMFLFPLLALVCATAPLFIPLLFGKAWETATPLVMIFVFGLASWPFQSAVSQSFRAHGKMAFFLRIQMVQIALGLCMTLFLFFPNGLAWMAGSLVGLSFFSQPVLFHFLKKRLGVDLWKAFGALFPSVFSASAVYGAVTVFERSGLLSAMPWMRLFAALGLGGGVFLLVVLMFQKKALTDTIVFVRGLFKNGEKIPPYDALGIDPTAPRRTMP